MSDAYVPSRRCDRCGDKWPFDELHRVELCTPTDRRWYSGRVCDVCVHMMRVAERLGLLSKDTEWWFRAP